MVVAADLPGFSAVRRSAGAMLGVFPARWWHSAPPTSNLPAMLWLPRSAVPPATVRSLLPSATGWPAPYPEAGSPSGDPARPD